MRCCTGATFTVLMLPRLSELTIWLVAQGTSDIHVAGHWLVVNHHDPKFHVLTKPSGSIAQVAPE
eukprot:SAG25_NODE_2704_length_1435_cov_13.526076_1_plen_64_part_10